MLILWTICLQAHSLAKGKQQKTMLIKKLNINVAITIAQKEVVTVLPTEISETENELR
jgi:hypothetical protein